MFALFASVHDVDFYAELTKFGYIEKKKRARKPSPASRDILNCICAFDNETTTIGEKGEQEGVAQPHCLAHHRHHKVQKCESVNQPGIAVILHNDAIYEKILTVRHCKPAVRPQKPAIRRARIPSYI